MSQQEQPYFECRLQLRWSDQDILGHINNARILTLVEEARVRAILAWTGNNDETVQQRVVRKMTALYERPVHYEPELTARVWVSHIGNTSFTLAHELRQDDQRCVLVESVMVMFDPKAGTAVKISDSQRAALEKVLIREDPA